MPSVRSTPTLPEHADELTVSSSLGSPFPPFVLDTVGRLHHRTRSRVYAYVCACVLCAATMPCTAAALGCSFVANLVAGRCVPLLLGGAAAVLSAVAACAPLALPAVPPGCAWPPQPSPTRALAFPWPRTARARAPACLPPLLAADASCSATRRCSCRLLLLLTAHRLTAADAWPWPLLQCPRACCVGHGNTST